jgi:putative oxidoreductase
MFAARLIAAAEAIPAALLALLFRIAIFSVFWRAAWPKWQNWDLTIALFQDEYLAALPFLPAAPMAYLAGMLEIVCSVLVLTGLATRPAAVLLFGMTLFIQFFVYWNSWPQHILWAVLLIYLIARGPGAWSLDHLLARRRTAEPA